MRRLQEWTVTSCAWYESPETPHTKVLVHSGQHLEKDGIAADPTLRAHQHRKCHDAIWHLHSRSIQHFSILNQLLCHPPKLCIQRMQAAVRKSPLSKT